MVTTLFGESQNYRRLSRARMTALGSLSLWEGPDHFVQVEVLGFSETHKRFYFGDIKALTVRQTRRGLWLHLFFGGLTIATAAIALWIFASGYSPGGVLDWLTVAVPSGLALGWLVHLALGPTCSCHVMTPVQNAPLGALARTRRARTVLGYLARRAQTAQGGPVGVEGTEPFMVAGLSRAAQPDSGESSEVELPGPGSSILYPVVSFASLLNAAILFSLLVWDFYSLRAVQILFIVGLLALGITCVADSRRRRGSEIAAWFKRLGWALFTVNGLVFLLWYGYGFYLAGARQSPASTYELTYVQDMLQISPHGSRFWFWVVLVDACISMLVGLVGLLVIFLGGSRDKRTAPVEETTESG
ncbi:MAG: hypothetical protein EHM23_31825 [Acidobacteria bacterium]|nr:MAG: hypothetical protein EHM23_31825 [Acidobacteriota bacterium]